MQIWDNYNFGFTFLHATEIEMKEIENLLTF